MGDKIFDEYSNETVKKYLKEFAKLLLNIDIKSFSIDDTQIKQTHEVRLDNLFQIETNNKEQFLLHIEMQLTYQDDLLDRLIMYNAYTNQYRNDKELAIINCGIVLYSANYEMDKTFETSLKRQRRTDFFKIIELRDFDFDLIFNSNIIELLPYCVFTKDAKETNVKDIFDKVVKSAKTEQERLNLLRVLHRFIKRVFKKNFMEVLNMDLNAIKIQFPEYYDEMMEWKEEGRKEGLEEGLEKGIEKGKIIDKQDTIIKILSSKKITLDENEIKLIRNMQDIDLLDKCIDEVISSDDKKHILSMLKA